MKLSVVIVNYNVKYFLDLCLESLYRAVDAIEVEVFVVDNASNDNSIEYLKERFPQVQYISNSENVGFSKANNQAIKLSKGEYVLLLNPDVVIAEDTLTQCIKFMDKHPQSGGVGVKMINGAGEFLPESKRGIPTPLSSFLYLSGLNKILPNSRFFSRYQLNHLDKDEAHQVDVLAGAFMMIRKTVLDKCGLLNEDYFMYGEDIDLSCRIVEAGFKNYYLPLPIIHFKGESASQNSHIDRCHFTNSMLIFFEKYGINYLNRYAFFVRLGLKFHFFFSITKLRLYNKLLEAKSSWLNFVYNLAVNYNIVIPTTPYRTFLIIGGAKTLEELRIKYKEMKVSFVGYELNKADYSLCRNQLIYAKELFSATHLVFCYDEYTFKEIINLLLSASILNYQIGFCSKKTEVIVTPQNIIHQ